MKYKLELIISIPRLDILIANAEDKLVILKSERVEETLRFKSMNKASERKANNIIETTSKLNEVNVTLVGMQDGPAKNKKIGLQKLLDARLYNLNLEEEATPEEELVESEFDREQFELQIIGAADYLENLNLRKTQIQSGTGV